ncbi:hypothetical protein [Burkholderia cenocepacia]|uniref:hypothetical protein n=3 Tax=Burkholderia cenocepacia TaxID=95486 RepID=UPI0011156DD6|nr:hypothetical protein [Burkholderia cenocepacia]
MMVTMERRIGRDVRRGIGPVEPGHGQLPAGLFRVRARGRRVAAVRIGTDLLQRMVASRLERVVDLARAHAMAPGTRCRHRAGLADRNADGVGGRVARLAMKLSGIVVYMNASRLQQFSCVQTDRMGCSSISGLVAASTAAAGPYEIR